MRVEDCAKCACIFASSLNALARSQGRPAEDMHGGDGIIRHVLGTDPEGSYVAVDAAGEIVGYAQAARRDQLWVLTQLFVMPDTRRLASGNDSSLALSTINLTPRRGSSQRAQIRARLRFTPARPDSQ